MTTDQLFEQDAAQQRGYVAPTDRPARRRRATRRRALAWAVTAMVPIVAAACTTANAAKIPVSAAIGAAPPPRTTTVPSTSVPKPKSKPKPGRGSTSTGATVGHANAPPPPIVGQVTFVGDSVGVDTAPFLQQDIPNAKVYAAVGRSWGEGESILQSLAAEDELGTVVVIELGLNGPITVTDFLSMMSIVAHVTRVVFLTIRLPVGAYGPGTDWWQDQNNTVLAAEVPHFHNALLANWYVDSAGHSSWFAPDGIHLNPSGGAAMALLVKQYA
jgi:hypothetical protein